MNDLFSDKARTAAAQLPDLLLPWYNKNKRVLPWRENTDPYRVWISEIMLQQTRVEAAKEHYIRFLAALPTVQDLAACEEDKLLKLWEGLGYYSRARNLQKAAKIVAQNGFPQTAEGLKKLPGIGDYTAGAIASIAFELPTPAVDGNVIRVLSRVLGDDREQEFLKTALAELLAPVYPKQHRGDFTQSLMELGATVCVPSSPLCLTCPLFSICKTHSDALPTRKIKAERKKTDITYLLFCDETRLAVTKRTDGVLKGTYGFFSIERAMDADAVRAFLQTCGMKQFTVGDVKTHKHIFSHIEWNIRAYPIFSEEDATKLTLPTEFQTDRCTDFSTLVYFEFEKVHTDVSLPTAFRWCMDEIDFPPLKHLH